MALALLLGVLLGAARAAGATEWADRYGGLSTPAYAGLSSFAGLDWARCLDERRSTFDVAILGLPWDGAVSYRPGARFGPQAIRAASRRQRKTSHSLHYGRAPYQSGLHFVDCDDVPINAYDPATALDQMEVAYGTLLRRKQGARVIALGGDHSIVLPILRALHSLHGPVTVLHFDAHLDTWEVKPSPGFESEQSRLHHGSFFWKAAQEGLIAANSSVHAGLRCRYYHPDELANDTGVGFQRILTTDIDVLGVAGIARQIRERVGERAVYLSIDIDVLDPAHAPGTGTVETGGWSMRELQAILRGLAGMHFLGMDVVEVSPPYDHADITSLAASDLVFELANLLTAAPSRVGRHDEL